MVALLTLALLLTVLVPVYVGVRTVVLHTDDLVTWVQSASTRGLPDPPTWLERGPLGERIAIRWRELAEPQRFTESAAPYARQLARRLVQGVGGLGWLVIDLLLTTLLCTVMLARGKVAALGVQRFAHRLAGSRGERAPLLAAQAIRAVALGVILTAVLQTLIVALGFAAVGVPFLAVLTALSFMLSVAQIGPLPILIGVVIWTYSTHGTGWGSVYLVWALICAACDNVLRPLLIKRGADLPLLLIFGGVIGGLVAFGVIGLFVGPVVLAVLYRLMVEWVDEEPGAVARD